MREAGWPEAGEAMALGLCTAARRPSEGPCVIVHTRVPETALPQGKLPVTSELYDAFLAWQKTGGAGAFAISAYGVWGFSHGLQDTGAAIQEAANQCLYFSRRTWVERQISEALLDIDLPCRIVALRES